MAEALDRPFKPGILDEAREVAGRYSYTVGPMTGGGFFARCVEYPLVMGDGPGRGEAVFQCMQAAELVVATHIELGEKYTEPNEPA